MFFLVSLNHVIKKGVRFPITAGTIKYRVKTKQNDLKTDTNLFL